MTSKPIIYGIGTERSWVCVGWSWEELCVMSTEHHPHKRERKTMTERKQTCVIMPVVLGIYMDANSPG